MLAFNFTPFPELRTAQLLLRAISAADVPALYRQRSNPAFMRYLDREPDQSEADTEKLLLIIAQAVQTNTGITWGIVRPEQPNELLGTVGFWKLMPEHHRAEIGYGLYPDFWGQGLMSEAIAAVLHYGFHTMQLHSVQANVNPQNAASIAILEKQGFVREGYFREDYYFRGQFIDSAIYSLLASTFQAP